jgi:protocatechuate 3,4-dioxygenase beta subunit
MVVYALPEPDGNGAKVAGDVVLPPPRIVRGVVTDRDGKPMPDTPVSIWGYNDDRERLAPNTPLATGRTLPGYGTWGILDMYVGRRSGRTDHLGRFAFGDLPPGEFHVVAYGARNAKIGTSATFAVSATEQPEPVRVETDASTGAPVPQAAPRKR